MSFSTLRCPNCGNAEQIRKQQLGEDTVYFCPSCNAEFLERLAKREYEKLQSAIKSDVGSMIDEAILNMKLEEYYNLRLMLCNKVSAEYTDSKAIGKICRDILKSFPNDFLANFFLTANTALPKEVADAINEIDEKENEASVGLILDFMIKSLREEYIDAIAALLDRCGKIFSPEKKQEYFTKFEKEAKNVREGIYEIGLSRDVFIAYSSKDMPAVIKLLNFIESDEIGLTCFAAFRNLQHGRNAVADYDRALKEAMDNCSIFLFVSSVNSRSFSCDALKKELPYIRRYDMANNPGYISYDQIPTANRKLRIEYRLDNKPTLADKNISQFFTGLTYVEDREQLRTRLCECMDAIFGYHDTRQEKNTAVDSGLNLRYEQELQKKDAELERLRKELQDNRKAEEEAKRHSENEAKLKTAEEEKKRKAAEAAAKRNKERPKREVKLGDFEIKDGVLQKYKGKDTSVIIPDIVKTIGDRAFYNCSNITEIDIPSSVKEIEGNSFTFCKKLKSVKIPNGVKKINQSTFSYCDSLEEIIIPNSVIEIEYYAFTGCSSLKSIDIPMSVARIGDGVFNGCKNLTTINVPSNHPDYTSKDGILYTKDGKTIVKYASGKNESTFDIPSTVTKIGSHAFSDSQNLTSIKIPSTVKCIGERAFYNCSNITKIDVPSSVAEIENNAFTFCKRLKSITIPNGITKIHSSTFSYCDSLEEVVIPDSVVEIEYYAFTGCVSLKSIDLPISVARIGDGAFNGCKNLVSVNVSENHPYFKSKNGSLYTKDERTIVKYASGKRESTFDIPSTVTRIGSHAFADSQNLTSIKIPSTVKCIGERAFYNCSNITKIDIPSSVTDIENDAFTFCKKLKGITIPNGVIKIHSSAFSYCDSLEEIIIPTSVKEIDSFVFVGCKRLTIKIPRRMDISKWGYGWDCGCKVEMI